MGDQVGASISAISWSRSAGGLSKPTADTLRDRIAKSLHPLDAGFLGRFLIFLEDVLGHALRLLVEGFLKRGLHVLFGGFGLSSGVANPVGDCEICGRVTASTSVVINQPS